MWSSVTERRIGTAGVSSAATAGSSAASRPSVSNTDWISARDVRTRDGVVADMRRDDLGGKGEKLAAVDALVFGHPRPLAGRTREPANAARAIAVARGTPTRSPTPPDRRSPRVAGDARKAQSRAASSSCCCASIGRSYLTARRRRHAALHLPVGLARCTPCGGPFCFAAQPRRACAALPLPFHPRPAISAGLFSFGGSHDLLHPLARRAGGRLALAELLAGRDRLPRHRQAARQRGRARRPAGAAPSARQAADHPLGLPQPGAQPRRRRREGVEAHGGHRLRRRHGEPRSGGVRGGGAGDRVQGLRLLPALGLHPHRPRAGAELGRALPEAGDRLRRRRRRRRARCWPRAGR